MARLLVAIATLLDAFYLREMGLTSHKLLGQLSGLGLNAAVAILNEACDPSQPSADAPHRPPSTFRATGREPPHLASAPRRTTPTRRSSPYDTTKQPSAVEGQGTG